jgi:beta-glucanase (GH16 family)
MKGYAMNKIFFCLPIFLIIFSAGCQEPAQVVPQIPGYKLLWSDEFDGNKINPANWTHEVGDQWHNNELQAYTDRPKNSYVKDGQLVIVACNESYHGKLYTSARLRTLGKLDFKYGRIEARIKLPGGGGMWPAFWMMPSKEVYGKWAAGGEIDIVEARNVPLETRGNIHYGGEYPNNTNAGSTAYSDGSDFSKNFHVYTLEWEPNNVRWYCDGNLFKTVNKWWTGSKTDNGTFPAPFDQDFHLLLNVAVGGRYTRCTDPNCVTASFPQKMYVDYVRVYQKNKIKN